MYDGLCILQTNAARIPIFCEWEATRWFAVLFVGAKM